jgi:FMN phosphatase YigB (HAD superfamily)
MSIRFIFFDLGNVLLRFDPERMMLQGSNVVGCLPDELFRVIYESGWNRRLETGKADDEEFFVALCQTMKRQPDYNKFREAVNDIFDEIFEIQPFLSQLASINFPRGILSNTDKGHWNHIKKKFPVLMNLIPDNHVLSFNVGAMKPDPAIYFYALEVAQKMFADTVPIERDEILFIDDLENNITGAKKFGFDTIQFTSWNHVANELKNRALWR